MVKKVITNLNSSNVSGPDCIPEVVLKNCELQLSYILPELFIMCLKVLFRLLEGLISNPCIKDIWGKICNKKLLHYSLVSKVLLNRIVDHLEKCGLFSDFLYGFRSSRSTADLLIVVSDRITRAFNRSGLLELQYLIHPRFLTGLGMQVFFTNLSLWNSG